MFFSKGKSVEDKKQSALLNALSAQIAVYFDLADPKLALQWLLINENSLRLNLPFAAYTQHEQLINLLYSIAEEQGYKGLEITVNTHIPSYETKQSAVVNIKNIIAVASGKGGVGKSATAVNMAFALMQEGASVGMLDADIYGPSLPTMLGNKDAHPESSDNKTMMPLESNGLVANSIGYLVPEEDAAVWRGPVASRALMQLINETRWPLLDYLIVDMPPGTGDVQLTMAQQVPLTAAVVVTTPQDLALADAQKGISMFEKVNIPVLGLVENMSSYACSNCGHIEYIFSQQGGAKLSDRYKLPLLGSLPLSLSIREYADSGEPLMIKSPQSLLANQYREIARGMSLQLALMGVVRSKSNAHIKGDPIAINTLNK